MISARRTTEKKEERYDLFTSLLEANEDELDGSNKLSDQELLGECLSIPLEIYGNSVVPGNIFIFLLAGTWLMLASEYYFAEFILDAPRS